MDNNGNIPLTGLPFNLTNNVSTSNSDMKLSGPLLNLSNDDLASGSQANTEKKTIKAVVKHSGEITGYELSDGEQVTKERGVELAKAGAICGVSVSTSRKGEEYLRSRRDDDESNNLNSLPVIEE